MNAKRPQEGMMDTIQKQQTLVVEKPQDSTSTYAIVGAQICSPIVTGHFGAEH